MHSEQTALSSRNVFDHDEKNKVKSLSPPAALERLVPIIANK